MTIELLAWLALSTTQSPQLAHAWVFNSDVSFRDDELASELTLALDGLTVESREVPRSFVGLSFRRQVKRTERMLERAGAKVAVWVTVQDAAGGFVQLVVNDGQLAVRTLQVDFSDGWQVAAALTVREILRATSLGALIRSQPVQPATAPPAPAVTVPVASVDMRIGLGATTRGPLSGHLGSNFGVGGELWGGVTLATGLFVGASFASLRWPVTGAVQGTTLGPGAFVGWDWIVGPLRLGPALSVHVEWSRLEIGSSTLDFWQIGFGGNSQVAWDVTARWTVSARAALEWTPYEDTVRLMSTDERLWSSAQWRWRAVVGLSTRTGPWF